MIPIECPNCGREGNVPPDRLNARLTCKGCQTVFHLDNTGRLMLGDPGSSDPKKTRPRQKQAVRDIDLAQTWNDIPKPVKYGVPVALLVAVGYLNLGSGESTPAHLGRAESAVRALAANERSRVVSSATSDSAEAAGKWFDLMRGQLEKGQIGPDAIVKPAVLNGSPEGSTEITIMVVMSGHGGTAPPIVFNLYLKKEGSTWMVDGTKTLAFAQAELKKGP